MDKFLDKIYKLDHCDEYFDNYLAAIGLNFLNRKLAKSISSSTQIVKLNDEEYCLNTIIPFKTHQQKFIPGQEICQTTIDGRKVRNIFTIDGNKLIERQTEISTGVGIVVIVREFFEKEMIGVSSAGNVSSKNWSFAVE